jgi:putative copper export protein
MAITVLLVLPVIGLVRRRRLWAIGPRVWLLLFGAGAAGLCVVAALNSHARTLGHAALGVTSVAIHLGSVGVWVGGLGALVLLAGIGWRTVEAEQRSGLLRQLVPRFSRLAIIAVAVVVITGVVNSFVDLAHVSDLWRTTYGRVILGKVGALAVALALAARHLWVTPRRLDDPGEGISETRTFARTSRAELVVLGVAVALASALIALVPGKTVALQANGPVNLQRQAGLYTVQLFVDQTAVPNEVHVTFVNGQGLAAAEVSNATASMERAGSPVILLDMRLLSPGHFVADAGSLATGTYRVSVSASGGAQASTNFTLKLKGKGKT